MVIVSRQWWYKESSQRMNLIIDKLVLFFISLISQLYVNIISIAKVYKKFIMYVSHIFVGFGHNYINAEQSDASTRDISQAIASQRHMGQPRFARRSE